MDLTEFLDNEKGKAEIREAIKENRFFVLKKEDKEMGFFTYQPHSNGVYIGNMWVIPEFRGVKNLLYLRKIFRDMFPHKKFNWRNRKRGVKIWRV